MPKITLKRLLVGLLMTIALLVAGIIAVFLHITSRDSFSFMGGDCPEPTSYGGTSITGSVEDAAGSPMEGIEIRVSKAEGTCPQSTAGNIVMVSNSQGYFEGGIYIHLGDPDLHITVSADGYTTYEFDVWAGLFHPHSIVEIAIVLAERIQVSSEVIPPEWATLRPVLTATMTAASE